ncbi:MULTISPECIES: RICIN domain-containing protein [Streptomyces]|uniref:RICIN domain-containing protein n=1 Tax=Streptomyces TaxID=1883 RepID=UPI0006903228|nr:RICIN domain-containing protein [Streptomyces durhamensis]
MTRHRVAVIAALVLAAAGLGTAQGATPQGPDSCVEGYVWRLATPEDHVCVDPAVHDQVVEDNSHADERRSPDGGPYGPATCLQGWVWREGTPDDLTCVDPEVRSQAWQDNSEAPDRWTATARSDGGNAHPFLYPDTTYTIAGRPAAASPTPNADATGGGLVIDAQGAPVEDATGTKVARANDTDSQRFQFVRRGDLKAHENAFQVRDRASGRCLTVAQAGQNNGNRVVMGDCDWSEGAVWSLWTQKDGYWQLRSRHSNKCLTAHNPLFIAPAPGAYLEQWTCLDGKNQGWRLVPVQ